MVSTSQEIIFHQLKYGLSLKIEIHYSVLWKLCFDQSYFRLVETIIGIRAKQFSKKELVLANGQLIFRLVETIFFSIFRRPLPVFFPSSGKSIFQGNPYLWLVETKFSANNGFHKQKKTVNKRILSPIDRNSDSTSQNEGFVIKIRFHFVESCFHRQEYLKKYVKNGFQQQERGYSIKNGFTLI